MTQQLQEEAQSPANLARLKVEVDYENKKLETSIAKEEKRVKQEAKKADSQKQKAVDAFAVVTTVLLVFEKSDPDLKEAGATGKKAKKQYAMTLWSDGPNVVPFSNFRGTFVLEEYFHAIDRGALPLDQCACRYCEGSGELSEAARLIHVAWHAKFRKFYALRAPLCKDRMGLTVGVETELLSKLVELWKQVDSEAPFFKLPACSTLEAARLAKLADPSVLSAAQAASDKREASRFNKKARAPRQKKADAKKAVAATQAAAIAVKATSGMRCPRERK